MYSLIFPYSCINYVELPQPYVLEKTFDFKSRFKQKIQRKKHQKKWRK